MLQEYILSVISRFECLLTADGTLDKYSFEGKVIAENLSSRKALSPFTVLLTVPDKNISAELHFENIAPGSSQERELVSVKLNAQENLPPVTVTERISTREDSHEDCRVIYPGRENRVSYQLAVKNTSEFSITKLRLTKSLSSIGDLNSDKIHAEIGKTVVEQGKLIWDIPMIAPKQSIMLEFAENVSLTLPIIPQNGWTSLIYEIALQEEKKPVWKIRNIQMTTPFGIETRIFKQIGTEGMKPRWDCQIALTNKTEMDLFLKKIVVETGDRKGPIYELSPEKKIPPIAIGVHQSWQSDIWVLEQDQKPSLQVSIESDFAPKIREEVLYDIAIPDSPFYVAKISGRRSISSVELTSPTSIRILYESVITNTGTIPLNDLEMICQFPIMVGAPDTSKIFLELRGVDIPKNLYNVTVVPSEDIPNCIVVRILIQGLVKELGGLKAGEEIRATIPLFLKLDLENDILKFPTYLNALVSSNAPLLEDVAAEKSIVGVKVKRLVSAPIPASHAQVKPLITQEVEKLSKLAVDAYNAKKFEEALVYCEQVLAIAEKNEDKVVARNFSNIIGKIKLILHSSVKNGSTEN